MAVKKKRGYTFLDKEKLKDSDVCLILSAVSFGILALTAFISFLIQASAGAWIGAMGLIGMLIGFYALFLGMRELTERRDNSPRSMVAAVCSGLAAIAWITVFLLGIHQ